MTDLTDDARRILSDLAMRYGLSIPAVEEMARAVSRGGGTMAQFSIPELGGSGQWMAGGMTMVGDMFDHGLKSRVDNLCAEIASAMASAPFFKTPQTLAGPAWWPSELGQPSSSGAQNGVRYAYFPRHRRIAVDGGPGTPVTLLDTRDHEIGGFGQQQSGMGDSFAGITFSSQNGQFSLSSLSRVNPPEPQAEPAVASPPLEPRPAEPLPVDPRPAVDHGTIEPMAHPASVFPAGPSAEPSPGPLEAPGAASPSHSREAPSRAQDGPRVGGMDILGTIERLAALRDAGALTEDEFLRKKTELLDRL